mmetsp:Transcript_19367/g.39536  ORF Transcript_19367/g.39536 Transcript_19367/m.39536 type:complete len:199 (-) Transcript_19367:369-965(-)
MWDKSAAVGVKEARKNAGSWQRKGKGGRVESTHARTHARTHSSTLELLGALAIACRADSEEAIRRSAAPLSPLARPSASSYASRSHTALLLPLLLIFLLPAPFFQDRDESVTSLRIARGEARGAICRERITRQACTLAGEEKGLRAQAKGRQPLQLRGLLPRSAARARARARDNRGVSGGRRGQWNTECDHACRQTLV